ncbi:uncharacterized protein [Physcomitrium patens]|uniref:Transmembrane protein 230 n=1 Tax=Physcomitrium patens TaxID=3218 RepID=A0A2K1JRK1_PHYPA|nr:uncharacterized protein LOC112290027 [Physcomitrium patens]PNR44164.1 hypothetical protein PHYPA_016548 [Physcomitrium patens]|eukprot:XP_024391675.1 uncharacterized protein LOC112290027 [Physcomitrella patens]
MIPIGIEFSLNLRIRTQRARRSPNKINCGSCWLDSELHYLRNSRCGVSGAMAYVDHTFSIRDDVSGGTFIVHNGPPVKEIALAVTLLALGTLGIIFGVFMAAYKVGGDTGHGIAFAILGTLLFLPGFYYTRIAYYAYKGYKGFSFSNIPAV